MLYAEACGGASTGGDSGEQLSGEETPYEL